MSEPEGALEEALLGGALRYSRLEAAQLSGLDEQTGQRLWRAMGFTDVPDEKVVFTDADVQALRDVRMLADELGVPIDTSVAIARTMAQSAARLAASEVAAMTEVLLTRADGADPETLREQALADASAAVPVLERLLVHVWRRHLAAAAGRLLMQGADEAGQARLAVGFVDLVGFTSLTRRATEAELTALVDRFEANTSDRIALAGGRVIKTLGDEVLFVHDDPGAAVRIALETAAAHETEPDLPGVRAGVALGTVVLRHGDVFGSTVNIASRLTTTARPGTVLVDREAHQALADDPGLTLRSLSPRRVRGYDHLALWVARTADSSA